MTQDKTALLPCPFCGGEAELGGYHGCWFTRCRADGCWAGVHGSVFVDEIDAIAAWNTRPAAGAGEVRDKALMDAASIAKNRMDRVSGVRVNDSVTHGVNAGLWASAKEIHDGINALRSIPPDDGRQPVGYLKPKHPAAVEPFYIDAAHRTEDWQKAVFTIPVFAVLPSQEDTQ